jgi:hypothetical protein
MQPGMPTIMSWAWGPLRRREKISNSERTNRVMSSALGQSRLRTRGKSVVVTSYLIKVQGLPIGLSDPSTMLLDG